MAPEPHGPLLSQYRGGSGFCGNFAQATPVAQIDHEGQMFHDVFRIMKCMTENRCARANRARCGVGYGSCGPRRAPTSRPAHALSDANSAALQQAQRALLLEVQGP